MEFEMKLKMRLVFTCMVAGMWAGQFSAFAGAGFGTVTKPANPALQSCIEGKEASDPAYASDPADCIGPGNVKGVLKLYQGGTSAANELTGFYDDTGKRCADQIAGSEANCIFKIEAWVTPVCPKDANQNPLTTCKRAETFTIEYQISQVKSLPGMPTFATVKTGTSDRPNVTVPYSAIRASTYTFVDCKVLYPNDINMQYQSGVDSMGQPICGKDPNQDTINALKEEMCKVKVQQVWQNGGTTASPCDVIQIDKVFKLTSNTSKTTTDCTNNGGSVYSGATQVTNFGAYPGGKITVNGTVTDEISFDKSKYGIVSSSPTFDCKKAVAVDATGQSWSSSSSLTLPPTYVPGTLTVKLVGGGGGGSGSGTGKGGYGGGAGALVTGTLAGAPSANCTVTVGGGGSGGDTDAGCNEWPQGTTGGGTTSISCNSGGGSLSAGGGGPGGQCAGSAEGTGGANSPMNSSGGGSSGGCGAGGGGTYYGAGGGGGSTKGADCGMHPGGSGYGGYAEANWKVYQLQDFSP